MERDELTKDDVAGVRASGVGQELRGGWEPLLRFFVTGHLPEHLARISQPFAVLAVHLVGALPRSAERTVALRKLLESKDAAVRAAL